MKHLYSYKYRLNPTPKQEVLLNKHFGCVRYLYNHFLEQRTTAYKEHQETQNYYDNAIELPKLKKDLPWLKEVGSQSLQYAVNPATLRANNQRDEFSIYSSFYAKN